MKKVKLHIEEYDFIERKYLIELIDQKRMIFAYGVSDCIDFDGVIKYDSPIVKNVEFSVVWVTQVKKVDFEKVKWNQDILNSSHIKCKAIIKRVISEDEFLVYFDEFGDVVVELESDIKELKENDKVEFCGTLKADLD